jgi:hypothetical protein
MIPAYSGIHTLFAEMRLFKKVLLVQAGIEIVMNSKYDGPAYQPATSVFIPQTLREMGGYPFVSPFISAKLKRARFFLRMEHANEGLIDGYWFSTLNYPGVTRSVRFGLSWGFYD